MSKKTKEIKTESAAPRGDEKPPAPKAPPICLLLMGPGEEMNGRSIAAVAAGLAPGLDWQAREGDGLGFDSAFAAAALELKGNTPATVLLAELGGQWMAELVVNRSGDGRTVAVRAQSSGSTAREAWFSLLDVSDGAASLRTCLGLYAAHALA